MSLLVYFAVLVVAAAGALFGLDLMTAPLPSKPFVPIIGTVNAPDKLERRVAAQRDQAAQGDAKQALSPVYPANPAGEKKEVRTVYPPSNVTTSNVTTGAASTASSAPAQPQTDQTQPAAQALQEAAASVQHLPQSPPPATSPSLSPAITAKDEPKADVATAAKPKVEPVKAAETKPSEQSAEHPASQVLAQPTANRCDVQACGAAYHSFRAADCTYQPFEGPRRACVAPPAAQPRSAERMRLREYDPRQERTARTFDQARAVRDYDSDGEEVPAAARPRPVRPVDDVEDDDYDTPRPPGRVFLIDPGYRRPWR